MQYPSMSLDAIRADIRARWLSSDGLMGLRPNDFMSRHDGKSGTTVPEENGLCFLAHALLLQHKLGVPKHELSIEPVLEQLSDGLGAHYRNPGRLDQPITHDCISAAMAILSVTANIRLTKQLYDEYGSFWKTMWYAPDPSVTDSGHVWTLKKRRWRVYAESGFYAFCDVRRHWNPLHRLLFLEGVKRGAGGVEFRSDNANHILLLWVKFEAIRQLPNLEPKATEALKIFDQRVAEYGGISRVFADYYQHPEHPNRRLSLLLDRASESTLGNLQL